MKNPIVRSATSARSSASCKTKTADCSLFGLRFLDAALSFLTMIFFLSLLLAPAQAQSDICSLLVMKAYKSSHFQQENLVINNDADWQRLWESTFTNANPKPPLPQIDFTRRTIIAVFQGVEASSGYEISIEGIVETENSLEVSIKAFEPGSRCGVLGVITEPFHIVEIEKTQKEIVFHVKHKIRNCG